MFALDVSALQSAGPSGAQELELVVDQINLVIAQIDSEQEKLLPVAFAFEAQISNASFGRPDAASDLSHHYGRAHEVTWKTLRGVKEDLVAFRESCVAARDMVRTADDESAGRLRAITTALEVVASGGHGRRSEQAQDEARQEQDTTEATA